MCHTTTHWVEASVSHLSNGSNTDIFQNSCEDKRPSPKHCISCNWWKCVSAVMSALCSYQHWLQWYSDVSESQTRTLDTSLYIFLAWLCSFLFSGLKDNFLVLLHRWDWRIYLSLFKDYRYLCHRAIPQGFCRMFWGFSWLYPFAENFL